MTTLVLTRREMAALMKPADYLEAVAQGFAALGEGHAKAPPPLHVAADRGGFHAKAATWRGARSYVALKFNANMPGNPALHGLPTIQGAILLFDGDDGRLLAVMDSIEVTLRRTAAATALAARHLARPDSAVLAVCGCGVQALPQIEALRHVLPLRRIVLWDIDAGQARRLRDEIGMSRLDLECHVAADLGEATRRTDAIVTCTTSKEPFLGLKDVNPGSFIAAVGADNPSKSEIEPALMASATVVVDSLAQCAEMGDLHHALLAGTMAAGQVHAELGDVVRGIASGRRRADEICLFDSTGVAVQDVASAGYIFERAHERGVGTHVDLAGA